VVEEPISRMQLDVQKENMNLALLYVRKKMFRSLTEAKGQSNGWEYIDSVAEHGLFYQIVCINANLNVNTAFIKHRLIFG